jgi:ferredoxin
MNELRLKARELLESSKAELIIGYEVGSSQKVHACFITTVEDTDKLVFDSRCVLNLAVYLTKPDIRKYKSIAVTAPIPVLRSIVQLTAENQIRKDFLVVIGISPDSGVTLFETAQDIEKYLEQHKLKTEQRDIEMLQRISSMDKSQRFDFWLKTLEPCFKCYACRAACPLCYCTQCTVDTNRPQWIPVPSHQLGNLEWHIMRALHMSGRCTDCEACAMACPIGIPLNLLTKKIREDLVENFGEFQPSVASGNMMSTFRPDDKENFIK